MVPKDDLAIARKIAVYYDVEDMMFDPNEGTFSFSIPKAVKVGRWFQSNE